LPLDSGLWRLEPSFLQQRLLLTYLARHGEPSSPNGKRALSRWCGSGPCYCGVTSRRSLVNDYCSSLGVATIPNSERCVSYFYVIIPNGSDSQKHISSCLNRVSAQLHRTGYAAGAFSNSHPLESSPGRRLFLLPRDPMWSGRVPTSNRKAVSRDLMNKMSRLPIPG
jgi:hypothetical protein